MRGKRRQKGERLNEFSKERLKYEIKDKNSEAGEIDKVNGGSMTQEKELKLREVGRRIAQIVQKKESRREKLM